MFWLPLSYADVQILMSSGLETELTANGSFQEDEPTMLSQSQTNSHSGSVNGLADAGGLLLGPGSPLRSPTSPTADLGEGEAGLANPEQANGATASGNICTLSCLGR